MVVVVHAPRYFFMTHSALPYHLYVLVSNRYLGPNMPRGTTPGIWHGIHSREGQMLMCHVMLETGAHWSGIPLHALSTTEYFFAPDLVMPWYAMGEQIIAVQLPYLEGLEAKDKHHNNGRHTGIMIDWADGYSRYPQEHKPLNLITLDSGPFVLMPNNYVVYKDKHFINDKRKDELTKYKRNEQVYWE